MVTLTVFRRYGAHSIKKKRAGHNSGDDIAFQ